jgi:hypothetical protein
MKPIFPKAATSSNLAIEQTSASGFELSDDFAQGCLIQLQQQMNVIRHDDPA